MSAAPSGPQPPLAVDLDGTLLRTDLLHESLLRLLRASPWSLLCVPFWWLAGRHVLKREVARRVRIDVARLPCNEDVLAEVRRAAADGRRLVLATAAHEILARQVFDHVGLFHELLCTDDRTNLRGERKRQALVARFGERGFDYAGNGTADLAVWRSARCALTVNAPPRVLARLRASGTPVQVVSSGERRLPWLLRSWRVHQWAKNLLVFVPLLAAHLWGDRQAVLATAAMFAAFCLCASAIYQVNDLLDLDADRSHPRKRLRPVASGRLPIAAAGGSAVLLLALGLGLAGALSAGALSLMLAYLVGTTAYSLSLKSRALVDLVALAGLYTLRIVAGAAAIAVTPSFWLLAFSMLIFLSLSTLKRCTELRGAAPEGGRLSGRGYLAADLPYLTGFGAAAGVGASIILALFVQSPDTSARYARPEFLWLLCPLVVYWIGRMWLKTGRGEMHDDPVVEAARDPASVLVVAIGVALVAAAV